jgi:hypothetical protein
MIRFEKKDVKEYLDRCIIHWRKKRDEGDAIAEYYVDAFQSIRMSLFGELLPEKMSDKGNP